MTPSDIKPWIKQNQTSIDINWASASPVEKISWIQFLRQTANQDVGLAHCIQHNQAARVAIELTSNIDLITWLHSKEYCDLVGTASVSKNIDDCQVNQTINGCKKYVSNYTIADYHVLWLQNSKTGRKDVIYVPGTAEGLHVDASLDLLGMEIAQPGNLVFDNVNNYVTLCQLGDQCHEPRNNYMNLAFCTVNLGLCESLLKDLTALTELKNITHTNFNLRSLEMQLEIYQDQWRFCWPILELDHYDKDQSAQVHRLYSVGKKMLVDIIGLYLMVGNSTMLVNGAPSQRFRDAIVYTTHRQNYYRSLYDYY